MDMLQTSDILESVSQSAHDTHIGLSPFLKVDEHFDYNHYDEHLESLMTLMDFDAEEIAFADTCPK